MFMQKQKKKVSWTEKQVWGLRIQSSVWNLNDEVCVLVAGLYLLGWSPLQLYGNYIHKQQLVTSVELELKI